MTGHRVYISESTDTSVNLAIEEVLLSRVGADENLLFLYENDASIVIGRFQNPWKECRTGLAHRHGIPVYRRVSGGGTVVHGPGNLNFSFLTGKRTPAKEENLDVVIRALENLGIAAFRNERFDLRVPSSIDGDLKISGSAFRQTSDASMHHATLLINANLGELKELLHQTPRDMTVKGVASVSSPVGNLSNILPGLAVADVVGALATEWGSEAENLEAGLFADDHVFIEALERIRSEWWIWQKTPAFRERFRLLPGYPDTELELTVTDGCITDPPETASFLAGLNYSGKAVLDAGDPESVLWLPALAARIDGD